MRWSSLALLLFVKFAAAQIDAKFIEHLAANGLKQEHSAYLKHLPVSDSANYYKAAFNTVYFNDSLFLNYYNNSKALCNADSQLLASASKHFLLQSTAARRATWFEEVQDIGAVSHFEVVYKASLYPKKYKADSLPEQLQKSFSNYKRLSKKSPALAAALSALVPGLGKLYAGKKRSAGMTFLLNATYAAQTIESVARLGMAHPLSIINAGAFAAFYAANIYGSYKAVKELRKEYRKQFLADAANLYN